MKVMPANVQVVPLDIEKTFQQSLLRNWYNRYFSNPPNNTWQDGYNVGLIDALRLLILYQHGGMYIDHDVIVIDRALYGFCKATALEETSIKNREIGNISPGEQNSVNKILVPYSKFLNYAHSRANFFQF